MADEFQTNGNWWESSRPSRFEAGTTTSPSSSALNSLASFGWSISSGDTNNNNNNMVDHIKSRATIESASVSGASQMAFGDKLHGSDNSSPGGDANNLHMMGLGLSNSQAMDWNHAIFRGEKAAPEGSFRAILQDNNNMGSSQSFSQDHHHQSQWRSSSEKIFHSDHHHHSSPPNHQHHHLPHHHQQSQFSPQYSSGDSTVTCQGMTTSSFNVDSALYGSPSAILQGLFGPDPTQQSSSPSMSTNLPYNSANFAMNSNSNEILPASTNWSSSGANNNITTNKLPQFLRSTNSPPNNSHLQFSNNAAFWNAPEAAMKDVRTGFFPALQPQFPATTFEEKPKNISEVRDSSSVAKKSGSEVASNKRSRNDQTTSTLPAFKVRKEKMGDRITALQQLVSPFGKTDTASVLSEAIEYIKFLHEQVTVLSTPYMKSGASIQHQQNIISDKSKDPEDPKQDLRSRGLCLVPVSSTFPVTHETTVDFWTPTFGGTFR